MAVIFNFYPNAITIMNIEFNPSSMPESMNRTTFLLS